MIVMVWEQMMLFEQQSVACQMRVMTVGQPLLVVVLRMARVMSGQQQLVPLGLSNVHAVPQSTVLSAGQALLWVGLLAWMNLRERRVEIGILRALGLRQTHVAVVFLGKAALLGLTGAVLGAAVAIPAAAALAHTHAAAALQLIGWPALAQTLVLTPLLTMLASWIPAMLAAQQDPAHVLREG